MELPPRARRIQDFDLKRIAEIGTTSACAENTATRRGTAPVSGNYLRVRGEYLRASLMIEAIGELPPRARRIPCPSHHLCKHMGTTSACAENTTRTHQ